MDRSLNGRFEASLEDRPANGGTTDDILDAVPVTRLLAEEPDGDGDVPIIDGPAPSMPDFSRIPRALLEVTITSGLQAKQCQGVPTMQYLLLTMSASLLAMSPYTDSAQEIREGLRAHDHAIHVKEGWIRDPFITRGPDNAYYLTGTTQMPGQEDTEEARYNTGLGRESLVGWKVQVWRTQDFINWEDLGVPFT
ncbi:MAG TPA: hypothetical protein VFT74_08535, partial [Isosphaeraceae bacterium]|nr:hypothetical protein [Isosphaeraceae bacterium]